MHAGSQRVSLRQQPAVVSVTEAAAWRARLAASDTARAALAEGNFGRLDAAIRAGAAFGVQPLRFAGPVARVRAAQLEPLAAVLATLVAAGTPRERRAGGLLAGSAGALCPAARFAMGRPVAATRAGGAAQLCPGQAASPYAALAGGQRLGRQGPAMAQILFSSRRPGRSSTAPCAPPRKKVTRGKGAPSRPRPRSR